MKCETIIINKTEQLKLKLGKIHDEKKHLQDEVFELQTKIMVLELEEDKLIILYQYGQNKRS